MFVSENIRGGLVGCSVNLLEVGAIPPVYGLAYLVGSEAKMSRAGPHHQQIQLPWTHDKEEHGKLIVEPVP